MGVRLNKVLSELNIGLQTAVDFLKKKSELGDIKDDATPNTKISDEQYNALVDQFSSDKAVKSQAEKLFVKKPKEPKEPKKAEAPEKAVTKTEEMLEQQRPQFKPVGKINLDEVGKKPKAAPAAEPQPAAEEKQEVKEEPVVEPEEEQPVEEKKKRFSFF